MPVKFLVKITFGTNLQKKAQNYRALVRHLSDSPDPNTTSRAPTGGQRCSCQPGARPARPEPESLRVDADPFLVDF